MSRGLAVPNRQKIQEDLMNSQWGGDGGIRDINELDKKHDLPKDKVRSLKITENFEYFRNSPAIAFSSTGQIGMAGTSLWERLRDMMTSSICS